MTIASGSLKRLAMITEVSYGVTPAASAFDLIRHTAESLNLQRDNYQSAEVRSDRQISDFRLGMRRVVGDIDVEASVGSHDALIAGALGGAWAAASTSGINLSWTSATKVIARATGSWITDGFDVGDIVKVAGFANGATNGNKTVTALTALNMTVAEAGGADEATGAGRSVVLPATAGKKLKAGVLMPSFSIERGMTDAARFQLYKGCVVNALSLELRPGQMNRMRFTFIGDDATDAGATGSNGTFNTLSSNAPMSAFDGVLTEGGVQIATITSMQLNLANGRQGVGVIGSDSTPQIFEGTSDVRGTMTALFPDSTLLAKFIAETESSIDVKINDVNGTDFHKVRLPRVKYSGAEIQPPKEGPIILSLPFQAVLDSVSGTNIIWQRTNT